MDMTPPLSPDQEAQLRFERELVAQGEADIAAGRVHDLQDVLQWIERRKADPNARLPNRRSA
jgi:predicted transcriptional regulator